MASANVYNDSALYSTVQNISGAPKTFGFLPPHGRQLLADEEFTVFGDIRQAIGGERGGRAESRRDIMAFEAALERGDIKILGTPSPILLDEVTGNSYLVESRSGALSAQAPDWSTSTYNDAP